MKDNFNARIALTKFIDTFTGQNGETVHFEYCEIEFAPNCFCTFKLNNSNKRALQKYAPNMYQLLMNIPCGFPIIFEELEGDNETTNELQDIYKKQQEEL